MNAFSDYRYRFHPEEGEANAAGVGRVDLDRIDPEMRKDLHGAYENYQADLEHQWANDPRWDEAEEEALQRALTEFLGR